MFITKISITERLAYIIYTRKPFLTVYLHNRGFGCWTYETYIEIKEYGFYSEINETTYCLKDRSYCIPIPPRCMLCSEIEVQYSSITDNIFIS